MLYLTPRLVTAINLTPELIILLIGIYILILWLIVSLWVINDARKRYNSMIWALLWGVLVFVLNFPTLIIYLLIRPDESWLGDYISGNTPATGSTIPLANFTDATGGIHMSLELNITSDIVDVETPVVVTKVAKVQTKPQAQISNGNKVAIKLPPIKLPKFPNVAAGIKQKLNAINQSRQKPVVKVENKEMDKPVVVVEKPVVTTEPIKVTTETSVEPQEVQVEAATNSLDVRAESPTKTEDVKPEAAPKPQVNENDKANYVGENPYADFHYSRKKKKKRR